MALPSPAEIPPATIRLSIAPEEWEACLESWLTLSDLYLRLPQNGFATLSTDGSPLVKFVQSFYHEKARSEVNDATFNNPTGHKLDRACFLLVHRIVLLSKAPSSLVEFEFLSSFCHAHGKGSVLRILMHEIWHRPDQKLKTVVDDHKKLLIRVLESSAVREISNDLRPLADIMRASPDVAAHFMTGSDFLDGLIAQHSRRESLQERQLFVTVTYLGLLSLVQVDVPNVSLLSDHLYSLKTSADVAKTATTTLITDLVTNTPLIAKLRMAVTENSGDRLFKLLDVLETYRTPSLMWPKKPVHKKRAKGKGKAIHSDGEMHMHRMSLVTQVQDLFPELGSGFVLKLLDEYGDDVEQVTAHLLDDSLPAHLRDLDRAEAGPAFQQKANGNIESLVPRSTPSPPNSYIPERRNVFDDDELDRLEVDTSRLHIGKKKDVTSDGQANKAAILSALAAFDSDDDERDDTYDVDDVGGTVDTAHPDGEPGPAEREPRNDNDMVLFGAYTSSPDLFARTADARKRKGRHALKAETRMTDEAIEGWAIMLQRDPRRMRKLEAQFNSFDGKQAEVARTAYREGMEGTETEDSDAAPARGGFRGGFQGRVRGRGGNVAGPAKDPKTVIARDRKEANKGSRANHNRRDQRARKMARGGFPG